METTKFMLLEQAANWLGWPQSGLVLDTKGEGAVACARLVIQKIGESLKRKSPSLAVDTGILTPDPNQPGTASPLAIVCQFPTGARLRESLGAIDKMRVLDRGRELGGIVSANIDGWDPGELVVALRKRRINTSAQIRVYAVIDYDQKRVPASLRISPHYYNEEIDQAVLAIRELLL